MRRNVFGPTPVITGKDAEAFVKSLTEPPTEEQKAKYKEIADGIAKIRGNQRKNAKNKVISILSSYNGKNSDEIADLIIDWFDENRLNFI